MVARAPNSEAAQPTAIILPLDTVLLHFVFGARRASHTELKLGSAAARARIQFGPLDFVGGGKEGKRIRRVCQRIKAVCLAPRLTAIDRNTQYAR